MLRRKFVWARMTGPIRSRARPPAPIAPPPKPATIPRSRSPLGHANIATTRGYLYAKPDSSSGPEAQCCGPPTMIAATYTPVSAFRVKAGYRTRFATSRRAQAKDQKISWVGGVIKTGSLLAPLTS